MEQLQRVKVKSTMFTAFYYDENSGKKIEVDGEFSVDFSDYKHAEVTIESCYEVIHQCSSCHQLDTKELDDKQFDFDKLCEDIAKQLNYEDY